MSCAIVRLREAHPNPEDDMAVKYTVTEDDGHQHTRTSTRHTGQVYTHAVVRMKHGSKAQVSYHSSLPLAQKALADARSPVMDNDFTRSHHPHRIGMPFYPDARIYPVHAEVKGRKAQA